MSVGVDFQIDAYRIGWSTWSHRPWHRRRWHRPWQAEVYSQRSLFCRRGFTRHAAIRKMACDESLERMSKRSLWQRYRIARKRLRLEWKFSKQ